MNKLEDLVEMVPYPLLFPQTEEGVVNLLLPQKVGKAKAGGYALSKPIVCRKTATAAGFRC